MIHWPAFLVSSFEIEDFSLSLVREITQKPKISVKKVWLMTQNVREKYQKVATSHRFAVGFFPYTRVFHKVEVVLHYFIYFYVWWWRLVVVVVVVLFLLLHNLRVSQEEKLMAAALSLLASLFRSSVFGLWSVGPFVRRSLGRSLGRSVLLADESGELHRSHSPHRRRRRRPPFYVF